jgi:hypothetical protein
MRGRGRAGRSCGGTGPMNLPPASRMVPNCKGGRASIYSLRKFMLERVGLAKSATY